MKENVTSERVFRCTSCGAIKPHIHHIEAGWHWTGYDFLGNDEYEHDCQKWHIVFNKPAPPMVGASHYAGVIENG